MNIVEVFANLMKGVFPDDNNNLKVRHFQYYIIIESKYIIIR